MYFWKNELENEFRDKYPLYADVLNFGIHAKQNSMKIGFDAKRAFLNSSGLGNYSRNTINALKTYFPENDLVLFSPQKNNLLLKNHEHFKIVSPKETSSKIYKSYWRTFKLGKELCRHNLNLFHGLSNELPAGIHKTGIPSLVTIHDLIFLRFPEFYKSPDRKIYKRKVNYACNAATKIIAISQQTKNDIVEFLDIPTDKIEVIYQCISPIFFKKNNKDNLVLKYDLPENFILSVGTIEKRKNQLSILKAVKSAKIENSIVFVGNQTPYYQKLENYIQHKKIKNRIVFLNNIPEKDLAGLYKLAALSIYNSYFEGFGLPVIESMASGCPVITSDVSCLPETAGNAAVLCNPGNIKDLKSQIKKILADEPFRNQLVERGKERAKLFHPKVYAEKLNAVYNQILKK